MLNNKIGLLCCLASGAHFKGSVFQGGLRAFELLKKLFFRKIRLTGFGMEGEMK